MNRTETFKDIPGYEGMYMIGDQGTVLSLKGGKTKELKYAKSKNGYLYVTLCKNGLTKKFRVHQLSAMAFLGHNICGMKKVVDHIDFNKQNNRIENLRIVSTRENCSRGRIGKSSKYVGVHFNKVVKKWVSSIRINGKKKHLGYFSCEIKARLRYESQLRIINL